MTKAEELQAAVAELDSAVTRASVMKVALMIAKGQLDDYLDTFSESVRGRRDIQKAYKAANSRMRAVKGAWAILGGNLAPKYLCGVKCTVDRVEDGRIYVVLDHRVGKYGNIFPIGCPADCVEIISVPQGE